MRILTAAVAALALVVLPTAAAHTSSESSVAGPKNLRGFLLRPDEPVSHTFSRTPAFAWSPVRAARCYQFEVATTRAFTENSLVYSTVDYRVGAKVSCATSSPALTVPAASINVALPWFTGQPSALYAHVRAITSNGVSPWSTPFVFDMRWNNVPQAMPAQPGLLRWTPVDGATGYNVWLVDVGHIFSTPTNVGDEREYYTFHTDASWTSTVHWRVRAERRLYGKIPNGLAGVSYGPWSQTFTSTNPAFDGSGALSLVTAVSDRASTASAQQSHELMPGFAFHGSGGPSGLYRVYIATDRDCINIVYRGAAVGSPAYAPRSAGLLKMPSSDADLQAATDSVLDLSKKNEGVKTFSADYSPFVTNEAMGGQATTTEGTSLDKSQLLKGAKVDLPDTGFPTTRYYWTVVPVGIFQATSSSSDSSSDSNSNSSSTDTTSGGFEYRDLELPQDACAAGRVQSFSKASEPVVIASGGAPFVSGLTPNGRLLAAAHRSPAVYGAPVVAWRPAVSALQYEVQWSRTSYPWNPVGNLTTYATSAILNLAPGRWFYRVRGLNPDRIGKPQMTWSAPVAITVAKPRFAVVSH